MITVNKVLVKSSKIHGHYTVVYDGNTWESINCPQVDIFEPLLLLETQKATLCNEGSFYGPVIHGDVDCGKWYHQLLSGFLASSHLYRVSQQ